VPDLEGLGGKPEILPKTFLHRRHVQEAVGAGRAWL
jgi:hypothetical protein